MTDTPSHPEIFELFTLAGLTQGSREHRQFEIGKTIVAILPPEKFEEGMTALQEFLDL